jgi:hypothetical protein
VNAATVTVESLGTASALEITRQRNAKIGHVDFGADSPPLEIAALHDALYVPSALASGQSLQIIEGKYLPLEAVFDDFTAGFVRSRLLKQGVREFSGFEPSEYQGDVCILGNVFSRNFTHWHEELMKVVAIEQAGLDCAYVISDLPDFARDLLQLMEIGSDRILEVRQPTRFRRALYSTPVSYRNVAEYPAVLMALREALLAAAAQLADQSGPRLWLDRGQQTRLGRKLVNEDEVYGLLERYGFKRLDMGALPVPEQIAVARDLEVLAGLHGSQFVHAQLMPQRSFVIECFSPLYLNPTYTEIYRVLRHRYAQLSPTNTPIFPYPHGADVLVDCQQLDLALRAATEHQGAAKG